MDSGCPGGPGGTAYGNILAVNLESVHGSLCLAVRYTVRKYSRGSRLNGVNPAGVDLCTGFINLTVDNSRDVFPVARKASTLNASGGGTKCYRRRIPG